jgi:isocitrate lyase
MSTRLDDHARTRSRHDPAAGMEEGWRSDERWNGVTRAYSASEVYALRGSIHVEYSIARMASEKLWRSFATEPYIKALGAVTGNQAVQMVKAGLKAIYLSGWQVAADANLAGQTYPDLSLYPVNSAPSLVKRLNQAFIRADQIDNMSGKGRATSPIDWLCPIVADCEAGFGGPLNAFELMKSMIEAGAAGVHFEDQLASDKKCGHMGGKVLVPTGQFIRTLTAARLAADVLDVSTVIIARTDARDANYITSDIDLQDRQFLTGERSPEGYFRIRNGLDLAIARGLAFAPYADMLWFETQEPNLEEAELFAKAIHEVYPDKYLAYNLSPSFNWDKFLNADEQSRFQEELGKLGYKFQFVTLAGFHALNHSMYELAQGYAESGLPAYVGLQRKELESEKRGYTATKHQSFVGASYFDEVLKVVSGGSASTTAMEDSTETGQFGSATAGPSQTAEAHVERARHESQEAVLAATAASVVSANMRLINRPSPPF